MYKVRATKEFSNVIVKYFDKFIDAIEYCDELYKQGYTCYLTKEPRK